MNKIILTFSLLLLLPSFVSAEGVPGTLPANSAEDQFIINGINPLSAISTSTTNGFDTAGLYGCKGGKYGSVGLVHARGPFVPVSEEAVALNTNMLLYKECVLDGIVVRVREAMIAKLAEKTFNLINKNFDGKSAFIKDLKQYRKDIADKVVKKDLENEKTKGLCTPFKDDVRKIIYKEYKQDVNQPEKAYSCSVPSDEQEAYERFIKGQGGFSRKAYWQAIQPENNPLVAYSMAKQQIQNDIKEAVDDAQKEADWGQGFKPHKKCKKIPSGNGKYKEQCETVTPGSIIKDIVKHTALTGQRQLENADEADELLGALMSNLHTEILTNVDGLSGLTRSLRGIPSYISRLVAQTTNDTRATYINTGASVLDSLINTESAYSAARKLAKGKIEDTAQQIETKDKACWDGLINQAQLDLIKQVEEQACADVRPTDLGGTGGSSTECTIKGHATVTKKLVATTTATGTTPYIDGYSTTTLSTYEVTIVAKAGAKTASTTLVQTPMHAFKTITQQITNILRIVKRSIFDSNNTLTILQKLKDDLSQNELASITLQQIDKLVKNGQGVLHSESDVYQAQEQNTQIADAMEQLYYDTNKNWNAGWCNPTNWRAQIKH